MHSKYVKYILALSFISNLLFMSEGLIFSRIIEALLHSEFSLYESFLWLISIGLSFIISFRLIKKKQTMLRELRLSTLHFVFINHQIVLSAANAVKVLQDDVEKLFTYTFTVLPEGIVSIVMTVVYFLYMWEKNAVFCIVIVIIGLLRSIVPLRLNRFFSYQYEKTMEMEEDISDFYYTVICHFHKAWFFVNDYFVNRLQKKFEPYYEVGKVSERMAQLENGIMNLFDVLSQFGLCFIGILLIDQSQISYTLMIAMVVLSKTFFAMIQNLCVLSRNHNEYKISKKRTDDLVGKEDHRIKLTRFNQLEIDVKPDFLPYRLKTVIPNQGIVLIKGENGSGKSTFLKILLNIVCDYQGEICLDGQNIRDIQMSCLCAYVGQKAPTFDLSAKELWNKGKKEEQLQRLLAFPDRLVNEKISDLSSGEQKKALLIGAFLSGKRILILDEPEASLDTQSQEGLLELLSHYSGLILLATNTNLYDEIADCEVIIHVE